MLIYRSSIDPETRTSPALVIFGRPIRDPIPIPLGRYCPHPTWQDTLQNRERALARRHSREHEKWDEHTKQLPPLKVGDTVYIQNLVGNHPRRWERTGVVVEVRQYHQYVVRVDGSGRVTLRNRQHLPKYTPFHRPASAPTQNYTPGSSRAPVNYMPPNPAPGIATPSTPPSAQPPTVAPVLTESLDEGGQGGIPDTPPAQPQSGARSTLKTPVVANDQVDSNAPPTTPTAVSTRAPRMLRCLNPHNAPGLTETTPLPAKRLTRQSTS